MFRVFATVCALLLPAIATAADPVGAEVCRSCHEPEYQLWRSSGHAQALARLSTVQQRDRVCRSCHTMTPSDPEPSFAGVQCESCHGGGSFYHLRYTMKDPILSRLLGLKDVAAETCTGCHAQDTPSIRPFNFDDQVLKVCQGAKAKAKKAKAETPAAKIHPQSVAQSR